MRPHLRSLRLRAIFALFGLSTAIGAQGFDAREATIASVHNAIQSGESCRGIISAFLSRVEALNHHVNAIISLDPDSLAIASRYDAEFASDNHTFGPLFCIPVLLKDNIDTASVPTTGGSVALADSRPSIDAPVVRALKEAGAIVLGKTNLQEMALEGISVSTLGGQTVNPYDSTRTPGGSSGGSGAAVAASFSVLSMGTDTMNSLRSPASANNLFSLRSTRGLISRAGIIPVSHTQDSVGPFARCVEDIAIALSVIAGIGEDLDDNSTALVPKGVLRTDYHRNLDSSSLSGMRIGVIETFFDRTAGNETEPVNDVMDTVIDQFRDAGVEVIPVNEDIYDVNTIISRCDTQRYELRQGLDAYLGRTGGNHPASLKQLYNGQNSFLVLPYQHEFIKTALVSSTDNITAGPFKGYDETMENIEDLKSRLRTTFSANELDAIVYPHQRNLVVKLGSPSQVGRSGILAAITGFPAMALPGGFSPPTDSAPVGIPIGFELMGLPWTEAKLLQITYQFQRLTDARRSPVWAEGSIPIKEYDAVPSITPDRHNIPVAYPLGRL